MMTPIRIYNSLTRKKEIFEPVTPGKVGMYVCGPTVYDACHIGHARSVVVFDVIARYLEREGFTVTYVRNFTDVDDKIIQRANVLDTSSQSVAERYIKEFHEDMDALNVLRPAYEPKATEHIDDIIHVIEKLVQKGVAYDVDGDVFYHVKDNPQYGKLSGRQLDDMEAGARIAVDDRKRDPFDFALWKAAKPGEPAWDSPWGKGRPGWHIECSAMSYHYLGETFDIHGGGKDLIFPHHENEIAQSEMAFGKPFAKYWIHNGFVNIDSEKMSKSLGNFKMIKDVLQSFHPEAVRFFLLSHHYRNPIDFSDKTMGEAAAGLDKLYHTLERLEKISNAATENGMLPAGDYWQQFQTAMNDDFNTARGIGVLYEAARNANRLMDTDPKAHRAVLAEIESDMMAIGEILGIFASSPQTYLTARKTTAMESADIDSEEIDRLVKAREAARNARDFATADQIRDQLAEMRVVLEDRPDGTIWRVEE